MSPKSPKSAEIALPFPLVVLHDVNVAVVMVREAPPLLTAPFVSLAMLSNVHESRVADVIAFTNEVLSVSVPD